MPRFPSSLVSLSLLVLLAAPAWANNPPPDEEKEAGQGGNAIDNAAQRATNLPGQPPGYYETMANFWAEFLAGGNPGVAAGHIFWAPSPETLPPTSSADLYILTIDGPAESVLDQIEESQAGLPMVGTPGSAQEASGATGAAATTQAAPAPEDSILDQIDTPPAASDSPANPDSAKPAVDQALPPQIVEAKGK